MGVPVSTHPAHMFVSANQDEWAKTAEMVLLWLFKKYKKEMSKLFFVYEKVYFFYNLLYNYINSYCILTLPFQTQMNVKEIHAKMEEHV